MRIAVQTVIIVLCCLLGGLALYSAIWIKFTDVEALRDQDQQSQLAMRDIEHLETMLNQWFVTIDLFFSQQQSYLAPGIGRQASQLQTSLNELGKIAPHEAPELQKHLTTISTIVQRASLQAPDDNAQWNSLLSQTDDKSTAIVELMDSLYSYFDQRREHSATAVASAEAGLVPTLGSYAAGYFGLVFLVWLWATRTVVLPLQKLHRQAMRPLEEQRAEPFVLDAGPTEIRRLGSSLNHYSQRLVEALHHAEEERENAELARARVESIMHAAPDAIITLDDDGQIQHMNQATLDMFTLATDAVGQTHIGELVPRLDQSPLALNTRQSCEYIGKTTAARKLPLEISAATVSQNEHQDGYTLIVRDITTRKLQEIKLQKLNQKLVAASRQAGIAEIATGILHNVGNVLNSVTTSAALLQNQINQTSAAKVKKVAEMMQNHSDDLPGLFAPGNKGQQLPGFISGLCNRLDNEQSQQLDELASLSKNIAHIAEIVASQQKFAGQSSVSEPLDLAEVLNDAIAMHSVPLRNQNIKLVRDFHSLPILSDRHNLMQIFVNLVRNATEAIGEQKPRQGALRLRVIADSGQPLRIEVTDNGSGLDEEQKHNLFRHGFTTKVSGHGFGLHSSALAAKNMQGELSASSEGRGHGCTFSLQLPASIMEHAA